MFPRGRIAPDDMTGSDKCDDTLPSSSWRSLLPDPTSRLDEAGGVLVRLPRGCVCDWGLLGCVPQRCWWENENGRRPSQAGMRGSAFRVSVAEGQASSSVAEISCSSLVPTDSAGQECGHAKRDSSWSLSYVSRASGGNTRRLDGPLNRDWGHLEAA